MNILYLGVTIGILFSVSRSLRSTFGGSGKGGDFMSVGKSNAKVFGVDT